MLDTETHKLLALFADNQPHSFFETCVLARVLFKKGDKYVWSKFSKRLLENGWIKRLHQSWTPYLDFYQLTPKGDECFRASQLSILSRGRKDEEAFRHYKYFNRSTTGKFGTAGMGKAITEEAAGLKEKFPHLYG